MDSFAGDHRDVSNECQTPTTRDLLHINSGRAVALAVKHGLIMLIILLMGIQTFFLLPSFRRYQWKKPGMEADEEKVQRIEKFCVFEFANPDRALYSHSDCYRCDQSGIMDIIGEQHAERRAHLDSNARHSGLETSRRQLHPIFHLYSTRKHRVYRNMDWIIQSEWNNPSSFL